jgi:hypothetical protein
VLQLAFQFSKRSNLPKPIIMMMINPVDKKSGDGEEPIHKK